ncbi:MAG: hypothetical protein ACO1NZ_06030 [Adhaeribacter sp.]
MENQAKDYSHIKGWGIDADPKNDPTYPMKQRTNEEHKGYTWDRPTQQAESVEVLHSNERPNLTAVFGTSTPPSGLSGMIRRFAFQHSENSYLHWLPLLLADRVNVVEGIIEDLSQGQFPNTFAEKGGKAVWEHNKKEIILKVAIGVALTAGLAAWAMADKKPRSQYDD